MDYTNMIKLFLDTGINPNIHDDDGRTPLYYAVHAENFNLSKLLIEAGANPDGVDSSYEGYRGNDNIPLSIACESCANLNIIKLLLDAGADPNIDRDETNLLWICASDHPNNVEAMKLLLDAGANPNDGSIYDLTDNEYKALNYLELAKLLLDSGCSLQTSKQILIYPCRNGDIEMVKLLLSYGADPNRKDEWVMDNGRVPLIEASRNGHVEIVKILLEARANPNIEDEGTSAIIYASTIDQFHLELPGIRRVEMGDKLYKAKQIIKLLLDAGADPYKKNKYNDNILTDEYVNPKLRNYIESYITSRHYLQDSNQRLAFSKSLHPRLGEDSVLNDLRETSIMQNISDRVGNYSSRYSQDVHRRKMSEDKEQLENDLMAKYLNTLEGGKHKTKKKSKQYTYPK